MRSKTKSSRDGRRRRKQAVKDLLENRNLDGLVELVAADKSAIGVLFSLLYEKDRQLLWRAIEAVGQVAAHTFKAEPETVRDWIRRQIWAMNEESGNMAWHAPETISEIVIRIPPLIDEYARIMAANIDEPVFRRGVFFASARIAARKAAPFEDLAETFEGALTEEHPTIRGSAALLLGALDRREAVQRVQGLTKDDGIVPLYDFTAGAMTGATVGSIVRGVLDGADLGELIADRRSK